MPIERDWTHSVTEIPEEGLRVKRQATPAVREALAAELDLIACERLEVRYSGQTTLTGPLPPEGHARSRRRANLRRFAGPG